MVPPEQVAELATVDRLAQRLIDHIEATRGEIAAIHVHGAKSKAIQDHLPPCCGSSSGSVKRSC